MDPTKKAHEYTGTFPRSWYRNTTTAGPPCWKKETPDDRNVPSSAVANRMSWTTNCVGSASKAVDSSSPLGEGGSPISRFAWAAMYDWMVVLTVSADEVVAAVVSRHGAS